VNTCDIVTCEHELEHQSSAECWSAAHSPNNPVQRTLADAASAISTGVRRALDSGAKIMRRNKNQASSVAAQQDDAFAAMQQDTTSMTVNTPSVNTPDGSNSGKNVGLITCQTTNLGWSWSSSRRDVMQ